jgi:hypothetical protein
MVCTRPPSVSIAMAAETPESVGILRVPTLGPPAGLPPVVWDILPAGWALVGSAALWSELATEGRHPSWKPTDVDLVAPFNEDPDCLLEMAECLRKTFPCTTFHQRSMPGRVKLHCMTTALTDAGVPEPVLPGFDLIHARDFANSIEEFLQAQPIGLTRLAYVKGGEMRIGLDHDCDAPLQYLQYRLPDLAINLTLVQKYIERGWARWIVSPDANVLDTASVSTLLASNGLV